MVTQDENTDEDHTFSFLRLKRRLKKSVFDEYSQNDYTDKVSSNPTQPF